MWMSFLMLNILQQCIFISPQAAIIFYFNYSLLQFAWHKENLKLTHFLKMQDVAVDFAGITPDLSLLLQE